MKFAIRNICFLVCFYSFAQTKTLIEKVAVFDGEQLIERTNVLILADTIAAIGKDIVSSEAKRIDGRGKTLMPALSNAHVHAWSPEGLKEAASAGVLNVMDMHGIEKFQAMLKRLNDSTNYATYYIAGAAATAPGGHGTQFGFPTPTLSSPAEAKGFISDRVKAEVDYVKIIVEPWKPTLSFETVAALISEAHQVNKLSVVHVSRLKDAMEVISLDADGLVHVWWDEELSSSDLKQLKESSFFVIPTILTTVKALATMEDDSEKYLTKAQVLNQVKQLYEIGVPLLAGTDPPNLEINYGTDLYKELQLLYESGLPKIEVLKAATSNVAKAFNLPKKGFVKPGFKADLIMLNTNPLDDLTAFENINTIWKNGKPLSQ